VVSSLDLQTCNIDYVVEEIGIERFDALLFVLLPISLMGRPSAPGDRPFDGMSALPAYLKERGREAASFEVSARSLAYIKIPRTHLPRKQIGVPVQIIACEALV